MEQRGVVGLPGYNLSMKAPGDGKKAAVVSFRCPSDLEAKLDRLVRLLRKRQPGGNWTRSSACLNLVALNIDAALEKEK